MLDTPEALLGKAGERRSRDERAAVIAQMRSRASQALKEIDAILARFDGRRLSEAPSALGTIAVESTPAGIAALSESDRVKAILQDQPVSRVV
jgi:sorbitol-specific phosphotransferase system component IIA